MSLLRLFKQIETGILSVEYFYMYKGKDWKQYVVYQNGPRPNTISLWKSKNKEILLKTWLPSQYEEFPTGHVIHSRMMVGSLWSTLRYQNDPVSYHSVIGVHPFTVFLPRSQWTLRNQSTKSVSLHFIQ
jgi:hypothetical protein